MECLLHMYNLMAQDQIWPLKTLNVTLKNSPEVIHKLYIFLMTGGCFSPPLGSAHFWQPSVVLSPIKDAFTIFKCLNICLLKLCTQAECLHIKVNRDQCITSQLCHNNHNREFQQLCPVMENLIAAAFSKRPSLK